MIASFILIRGPLGCGKTTIARALASRLDARCVHVDDVLAEHGLEDDREDGYISQKSFITVNEIIASDVQLNLQKGTKVIIEGNFYWQSQIEDFIKRFNYPHQVFTLKAPIAVCIARDTQRDLSNGEDAVRAVYAKTMAFAYGTVIDATASIDDCVDAIYSRLI